MRILLRVVAIVLGLIAALLIYAIINAATSDAGARVGVCILYAIIAIVALVAAGRLWRGPTATRTVA